MKCSSFPQAENLRRAIALKDVRKRADDLGETSGEIFTFSFKKGETYGKNNTADECLDLDFSSQKRLLF